MSLLHLCSVKSEWFSSLLDDVKMLENDPKRFERLAQEAKSLLRPTGDPNSDDVRMINVLFCLFLVVATQIAETLN